MHTIDALSKVSGFEWDKANWDKCQKHGVSTGTIENALRGDFSVFFDRGHSEHEQRYKVIATTKDNRHILLVLTLRKHGHETFIRVISARYMHKKEVLYYEKEATHAQDR